MTTTILTHFSFTATLTTPAVVLAVIALVCGGWAFHSALYSTLSPSWVRADVAIIAVSLYAFAFGRLHFIAADSAAQILAYSVGFLAASMLEPLSRARTPEHPDQGD